VDKEDAKMSVKIPEERWERLSETQKNEIAKDLFSGNVSWGIYNMVPDSMRNALSTIDPRWMEKSENFVTSKANPTERDENFRLSFWTEYNTCKDMDKPFSMERVMAGACSEYYYRHVILKKPRILAYVLYPPTDYISFMKNMLYKGQQRMKEIMQVSAVSQEEGETKVDMKLATLQLKTFALLDNRIKGAIVQRVQVEQKNLNVNVDASKMIEASPTSVIDIDRELKELDKQIANNELNKAADILREQTKKDRTSSVVYTEIVRKQ
jgi:hypothetical protein